MRKQQVQPSLSPAPRPNAPKPKPLQSLKMAASKATVKVLPVAHAAAQYAPGFLEALQLSRCGGRNSRA